MKQISAVVGYGELVFDHYFQQREDNQLFYVDSRGGGPVWNVVANLASFGVRTVAYGIGGLDQYGQLACHDLERLGVNISRIELKNKQKTRIIYEKLHRQLLDEQIPSHTFHSKCIVCGRTDDEKRLALSRINKLENLVDNITASYYLFDNITKDRISIAEIAQSNNDITCLDLGRVGSLRYIPVSAIVSSFNVFDLVFMPTAVERSLCRRLSIKTLSDLQNIVRSKVFFVTDSESGVRLYLNCGIGKKESIQVSGITPKGRVDGAGAGDLFMALIVNYLLQNGVNTRQELREKCDYDMWEMITTKSVDGVMEKLFKVGARGHLPKKWMYRFNGDEFRGKSIEDIIAESNEKYNECKFCGLQLVRKQTKYVHHKKENGESLQISDMNKKRHTAIQNTHNYLIRRAFFAAENVNAVEQCKQIIKSNGTTYVVGTGGSYSVAEFIATSLRSRHNIFAQAVKPYDYIRCGAKSDNVVIISYSGNTMDCQAAISHARGREVNHIYLLTGSKSPLLRSHLTNADLEINYSRSSYKSESGFVSIAGTVAPIALWCSAEVGIAECSSIYKHDFNKYSYNDDVICGVAERIEHGGIINVFGTGWAKPAIYDLESKFTEGNIGVVRIHESKDFSHGRFMSLFRRKERKDISVLIRCGKHQKYEDALVKRLGKYSYTIDMMSDEGLPDIVEALKLIVNVQFFVTDIASKLKIDISRPGHGNISKDGLYLYKWKRQL